MKTRRQTQQKLADVQYAVQTEASMETVCRLIVHLDVIGVGEPPRRMRSQARRRGRRKRYWRSYGIVHTNSQTIHPVTNMEPVGIIVTRQLNPGWDMVTAATSYSTVISLLPPVASLRCRRLEPCWYPLRLGVASIDCLVFGA